VFSPVWLDSPVFEEKALKCDFRRFLRYGVKFDIGALLTIKFLAVWRFIISRQQEGMHAYAFLSEKQKIDL
ncbi:hypothetical protein, partial [Acinetobacter sp. YH12208]